MKCPHCGSPDLRPRPRRLAFYPFAYAAVLGLPLSLLHQASVPREYHCRACGKESARRTVPIWIAFVGMIIWAVIYVLQILVIVLTLFLR